MTVDPSRVFSVPELCNDLLAIEAAYAEFKLSETPFGTMAQFIAACSRDARDQYHIELDANELKHLMAVCGLSTMAQKYLIYTGNGYADAINSFSPFILVGRTYVTTVTLLSRFAYNWKTICLSKIKRFQIRSGFMFEEQVKNELEKQGFLVSDIKRIERKEFDVIATKNGIIYNVQCKNNLIDLRKIEENPNLFARYNQRLNKYYAKALHKEEERESLLKKQLGIETVRHIILTKFPVATKNPRILAFREVHRFDELFSK